MQQYISTKKVNATPMTRKEYTDLRGWVVPDNENPNDLGYLVEDLNADERNDENFLGYITWLPKRVFERTSQIQPTIFDVSDDDKATEDLVVKLKLEAPRVDLGALTDKIKNISILKYETNRGSIMRFAILTLENGFEVEGRPSISVSKENDNEQVGVKVAIENAINNVWQFLGYAVVQKQFEQSNQ